MPDDLLRIGEYALIKQSTTRNIPLHMRIIVSIIDKIYVHCGIYGTAQDICMHVLVQLLEKF